jgi:hypothetical protein
MQKYSREAFLTVISLLAVAGMAAACNLPTKTFATKTIIPSPVDLIGTAVAKTLTMPVQPSSTFTLAAPLPSASATIEPSPQPTSTITLTETPTLTFTPQDSATPTVTPTVEDVRSGLGEPIYKDNFDKAGGFFQKGINSSDDGYTKFIITEGRMTLTSYGSTPYWLGWRLTYPVVKDLYLEAVFTTQACTGKDEYGLVLRAPNYDSGYGYYLAFACDGTYRFSRWDDNGTVRLTEWIFSTLINPGGNQTNRLGIWAKGNTFRLYANGKLLQEVSDSKIDKSGHFGPFIANGGNGSFSVDMDDIAYWNVP